MWVQLVLTDVDRYDRGQAYKMTTDDHSSPASHWTVQWPDAVHHNLTP